MVDVQDAMGSETARAPDALAFEDVSFAYERRAAVRQVTLRVAQGEMLALLGPNGAGKSTLLKLAAGVLRPDRGRVCVRGDDVRRLGRREIARRVAVVPQEFSVQFAYTVRQVVEMGRTPHAGPFGALGSGERAADRAAVQTALEVAHAAEIGERVFNELSGGERQRVLVALALAQDAGIVLLDEPTAHLDIKHQIEVLDLLRRLNAERGLTVIAALHDLNLAARYFPRLVLFDRGVVADGPPARVLESELLSAVYETPVRVGILRGETHLSVLPPGVVVETVGPRSTGAATPVHVLAGGGSGEIVMRALADAGIGFGAGPLNIGDSDYALAQRLATEVIAEPPYAPVSSASLLALEQRLASAEVIVCCPAPLGPGNIAAFEAALAAAHAGTPTVVLEPGAGTMVGESPAFEHIQARDFSGRGIDLYRALGEAGAMWADAPGSVTAAVVTALGHGTAEKGD